MCCVDSGQQRRTMQVQRCHVGQVDGHRGSQGLQGQGVGVVLLPIVLLLIAELSTVDAQPLQAGCALQQKEQ